MAGDSLSIVQTGLQSVETAMQAVSNNLSNAETTGYQAESVDFGTLLGEYVAGSPLGGGVAVTGITRDFSQGAIVQSNSPTDLAIQGNGFFVFQDSSGNITYSRNGAFNVGPTGQLTAFNGSAVMGYTVNAAGQAGGVLGPITIPQGVLAPTATANTSLSGNLNASSPTISNTTINPANPSTYSSSVSVQAYDSLGNPHVLTFYFQNTGPSTGTPPTEQWNWTATLDGSQTGLAGASGTLSFNSAGALVGGGIPAVPLTAPAAGAANLSINLNFSALTQFAGETAATGTADGNAVGRPVGIQVNDSGLITESYSNGQTINIAQVAVATFPSDQGLQLTNGGVYQESSTSGQPTIATAGAGAAGTIQSSSLESSNVDTTSQLVQLVVLQQNFQSNAKALQTEENIMGTLMQIQTT
jgi:flagellar hook protein FlgE